MGALSNFALNSAWLTHLCGASPGYTPAATIYLALSTGIPTAASTGASMSEVPNSNNYGRAAITFSAAASGRVTQNAIVTFNQASGAWGTVKGWVITDSITYGAGNALAFGSFSSSFVPVNGSIPNIDSGKIYVNVGDYTSGIAFTTAFINNMLNLIFRNVAYSQPATYVALLHAAGADGDIGIGSEVTGTGYSRTLINKAGGASPAWNSISAQATSLANTISWTVGAGDWISIMGAALVDASSGGNEIGYDNNDIASQTPVNGDTVQFLGGTPGSLVVSLN